MSRGIRRLRETRMVIDDQIGERKWCLGERFGAVGIHPFMLTTWLSPSQCHPTTDEFPNVRRIAEAVMPRPSVRQLHSERLEANRKQGSWRGTADVGPEIGTQIPVI